MLMEKPKTHIQHPSMHAENQLWQLAIGLELPDGVQFFQNRKGTRFLGINDKVAYPRDSQVFEGEARNILLDPEDDPHSGVFKIPENSTTLLTVLNEAAGSTDSFELAPDESRTVSMLTGLYRGLAKALKTVRDVDLLIPASLSYSQVLVKKDSYDFKLLPPVELRKVEGIGARQVAWRGLYKSLVLSMAEGADTPSQRHLVETLRKPIRDAFLEN